MFEKYSEKARRVLFFARYEASRLGSPVIDSEHLLLGILREGEKPVMEVFRRARIQPENLRQEIEGEGVIAEEVPENTELPLSSDSKKALAHAASEAEGMLQKSVGSEHLLLGVLKVQGSNGGKLLRRHGLDPDVIRQEVVAVAQDRSGRDRDHLTPLLSEFGRDLTQLATEETFDPLIGRERELERIVQVLSRRNKNNPILLGEPGVGKTAIVEGLAQRIVEGRVPLFLASRSLVALDLSLIVAGTKYRGQFEERLKGVLEELRSNGNVVVFIDEIHTLVGAGSAEGSLDAANILKPALSRGEITCIGATTPKEFRQHVEKDRSLQRRFQPIDIRPPSAEETREILEGLRSRYEAFHKVGYADESIRAAIYLSDRYISDRFQPDKALDVLDEAGSRVKLRRVRDTRNQRRVEQAIRRVVGEMKQAISEKSFERAVSLREREIELREDLDRLKGAGEGESDLVVARRDVDEVISSWTGVPVASLEMEEAEKLRGMEASLRRRVVGQDRAVASISRAIRRSRLGVSNPDRPVGSFIFLGPSGVGKTEVARRLAEFLFGSENALVRIDMSEYMEKHAVSRLIGSPPGYVGHEEGGQLTEQVRRQPYSLILFDEVEKAHPDVSHLLLQILEDGLLTDAYGNRVDFKNALVLMTCNIGSKLVLRGGRMGFGSGQDQQVAFQRLEDEILAELRKTFSPEFINRLDEIIVFNPLGASELRKIVDILLEDVNLTLRERNLELVVSSEARDWLLARAGTDPSTGARPLRRTIQRHVQDAVSELLIEHRDEKIERIQVSVDDDELLVAIEHLEVAPRQS